MQYNNSFKTIGGLLVFFLLDCPEFHYICGRTILIKNTYCSRYG